MTKWLAPAGIAAMLMACANVDRRGEAMVEQPEPDGKAIAAQLGYHGPVRPTQRMGAGPAPSTFTPDSSP